MHFCPGLPTILVACKKDLRRDPRVIDELRKTSQRPVTPEEVRVFLDKPLRHSSPISCSPFSVLLFSECSFSTPPHFEHLQNSRAIPQSTFNPFVTFLSKFISDRFPNGDSLYSYRVWPLRRRSVLVTTLSARHGPARVSARCSSMRPAPRCLPGRPTRRSTAALSSERASPCAARRSSQWLSSYCRTGCQV
jgi:hypothetical protein